MHIPLSLIDTYKSKQAWKELHIGLQNNSDNQKAGYTYIYVLVLL